MAWPGKELFEALVTGKPMEEARVSLSEKSEGMGGMEKRSSTATAEASTSNRARRKSSITKNKKPRAGGKVADEGANGEGPDVFASVGNAVESLGALIQATSSVGTGHDASGKYTPSDEQSLEAVAAAAAAEAAEAARQPLAYSLVVPPDFSGRLRMRCWSQDELLPSQYSREVKLTRYVKTGKNEAAKHAEDKRREYFVAQGHAPRNPAAKLWQSLPSGAAPTAGQSNVVGSAAAGGGVASGSDATNSTSAGGASGASAAATTAGTAMVYDVPEPPALLGLELAGAALAGFYEWIGIAAPLQLPTSKA